MKSLIIFVIYSLIYFAKAIHLQMINADGVLPMEFADLGPFTKIGNKYYWIEIEKELNWFAAANFCRTKGAQLASLVTEEDAKLLYDHLKATKFIRAFWIGANDLEKEGEFHWLTTGLPVGYTTWYPGEPNNSNKNEHCVHFWFDNNEFSWNDRSCMFSTNFICEAPTPKSVAFFVW